MNKKIIARIIISLFITIPLYAQDAAESIDRQPEKTGTGQEEAVEAAQAAAEGKTAPENTAAEVKKEPVIPVPENLAASQGKDTAKINLTWEAATDIKKYQVYRSEEEQGEYDVIGTSAEAEYTDTNAGQAKIYYYKVRSVVTHDKLSGFSKAASGYLKLLSPEIAVNPEKPDTIEIFWQAVPGAEKYYIFRLDAEEGEYKEIGITEQLSYEDTTALPGKQYFYRTKAYSQVVEFSGDSNTVSAFLKLGAPAAEFAEADTEKVVISWNEVDGAEKYHVYRSDNEDGKYTEIGETGGTSFEDTEAFPGRVYFYKLKSFAKTSGLSEAGTAIKGHIKLKAPVITIDDCSIGEIKIKWGKIRGAEKYYLYRAGEEGEFKEIAVVTGDSYIDKKIEEQQAYTYKIKAKAPAGFSGESAPASGRVTKTMSDLYLRSIVPGWGQVYQGRQKDGYIVAGAFGASAILLGLSLYMRQKYWVDYAELPYGAPESEFDTAYNKYKYATYSTWFFCAVTAGIYAVHWYDVLVSGETGGIGEWFGGKGAGEAGFAVGPIEGERRGARVWARMRF